MAGGGFGGGAWGGGPWGGSSLTETANTTDFDVFCFQAGDMYTILSEPIVSTDGDGGSFYANPSTLDLEIRSGSGAPTDDARLTVTQPIPSAFTVEWICTFEDLPNDFTNLVNQHIYLSVTDAAGPLVGFFFSKVGLAYTGSVSFPGGNLQLDTTFQPVPGSADYVLENVPTIIRAAADLAAGVVYVYVTKLSEFPITGQVLRAILPIIPYTAAATTPTDKALISVRGSLARQSALLLDSFCVGSGLLIPNVAPVANAGTDQAVRTCSVIQLNGSQSYDPEGANLLYQWRLIEAPATSMFVVSELDGFTVPVGVPNGYTDKFYSVDLALVEALDPITLGDVLLIGANAYTITAKGTDGTGFFLQIDDDLLVDNMVAQGFRVLRQHGLSNPTSVLPTFFPDKPGFYKFDLIVFDGGLTSATSVVLINVLESPLPRGCVPDLSFIFSYLSDFWNLVEDRERIQVFWSSMAQVASTELFSLWQIEYSKSLRDIQRTFNRRWLHYDLLLPEPLPELTKVHAVYGGITSVFMDPMGESGVQDTTFTISSPLFSPVVVTIRALDAVRPQDLAADVEYQLRTSGRDEFRVFLIENDSGMIAARIDAPFPFILTPGSCPLFVSSNSSQPHGGGNAVGARLYKVDRSLEGLGLVEDDFLVLGGVAYRIARLVTDPTDTYAYQRVVTKEDLPVSPPTSWMISGWVQSELLDFYNGLVSTNDYADFEVAASVTTTPTAAAYNVVETRVIGVSEAMPSRMAIDAWPLGSAIFDAAHTVYLARVLRRNTIPVHELVVDVPILQENIVNTDDTAALRRNVDFFITTVRGRNAIQFVTGSPDVWEGTRPVSRLWAEYTYLDNRPTIEANFGIPVGLRLEQLEDLPDNVDYLSAVRGLWYAICNGPTLRNLRVAAQILLGLPFAEEAGTIVEIRTDFSPNEGRILIRDANRAEIVRSYHFPKVLPLEKNPATLLPYTVGDMVELFAPLVEGVEVVDYIKDPKWFEGILNQGVFYEIEKFNKFLVRVNDAAFSLSSLVFVRNFVLKVKPTYTFPLFVVQKTVGESEISTTDQVSRGVSLTLYDSPCEAFFGAATIFDEPRAAGGGNRSFFDTDADPNTPLPVFDTPDLDADIMWAFDRDYLCPEDSVAISLCKTYGISQVIPFDGPFAFDTPIAANVSMELVAPGSITPGPVGTTLSPTVNSSVTGTITNLRFAVQGTPDGDPTNYTIVLNVNGSVTNYAFTGTTNAEVVLPLAVPVTTGNPITVSICTASGGARTPSWSTVTAELTLSDATVWDFDDVIAAGTYCLES